MNAVQCLLYVFASVACSNAGCCKKVCVLDDVECVTKGGHSQYKAVVAGIKGVVGPMDPLFIEGLDGTNGSSQHTITNIELKGLKDCAVTQIRINMTHEDYEQHINCPKLISIFNYDANETCPLDDKKVVVTAYDYKILNAGQYGILVGEKDLMPHFYVKSVLPSVCEEFSKEKPILDIQRFCDAGDEKSPVQVDDIPNETGGFILSLIVKRAMRILFVGIDAHNRKYLMGEVIPGSNMKKPHKNHLQ